MFGHTSSSDNFPLVKPYQDEYMGGDFDMFICKFTITGTTGADIGVLIIGSMLALTVVAVMFLSKDRIRSLSLKK